MALTLGRKPGQRVHINGPCIVTVNQIRADQVRLDFEAEPSVDIVREELLDETRASRPQVEKGNE